MKRDASKVTTQKSRKLPDDFASVAKRLGCDPDLKVFDKKLGKIAKAKLAAVKEK